MVEGEVVVEVVVDVEGVSVVVDTDVLKAVVVLTSSSAFEAVRYTDDESHPSVVNGFV